MVDRPSLRRIDAFLGRHVDHRSLVPLRIAAGLLTVVHLMPIVESASTGRAYPDVFFVPYWSAMPQLPGSVYGAALWAGVVAGLAMSVGIFSRAATTVAAGVVVGNLALSQTHYHHNRAFLAAILVALALMPVGERISLDRLRGARPRHGPPGWGPQWPLLLLRLQVAVVYTASGIGKLLDRDWFGGVVTRIRVERDVAALGDAGLPSWLVDAVASAPFHAVFAKVAVVTEIVIGLGLLHPRSRRLAVWLAIPFHVAIELTADVQMFSYAALAALVIWVRPTPPDRRLGVTMPAWRWLVRSLDWTGRLEVEQGPTVTLEGTHEALSGWGAVLRTATLLPLTFWFAAPLWAVRSRTGAGRRDHASRVSSVRRS